MDLFLMRHAVAAGQLPNQDDGQRPLTEEGQRHQRLVVQALAPLLGPLDHLLTSPLVRARQTSDIVAEALGYTGRIHETTVLAEDCTVRAVCNLLYGYSDDARVLCVGHEPDMSRLSAVFLDAQGRSTIAFQPGSVIGLTFRGRPKPGSAILHFFVRSVDLLALITPFIKDSTAD